MTKRFEIGLVPPTRLYAVLPTIMKYIPKAAEWTIGTSGKYRPEHIINEIFSCEVQLWLIFDEGVVDGFITTKITQYTNSSRLTIVHAAGEEGLVRDGISPQLLCVVENYARSAKCDGVDIVGRAGWHKFVKQCGYEKKPQVVYFKDFKEAL